jgi:hypothetical protein
MDIQETLELAPQKIFLYCSEENKFYALMVRTHEDYKQQRARKYLEMKVMGTSIKDIDSALDCNEELISIKSKEVEAEINYREQRMLKERASNYLQVALEIGRTKRSELRALGDTVTEK